MRLPFSLAAACTLGLLLSACAAQPDPAFDEAQSTAAATDAPSETASIASGWSHDPRPASGAYLVVLGIGQDGGVPQTGDSDHAGWTDPTARRLVSSIAVVSGEYRFLFDATPDLPVQLWRLNQIAAGAGAAPEGIFLTHAHMGHYTGLMHLGHESMSTSGVAVYATPSMSAYLRTNGPWSQLVNYENIALHEISTGKSVDLAGGIRVTAVDAPHRREFSDTVGFRIDGPRRTAFFLPDIDGWDQWIEQGVDIEDVVASVDIALVDGSFYSNNELPGRDMSGFPHPRISLTMDRLGHLPDSLRSRVVFIHLNHSNPALYPDSPEAAEVRARGFRVAHEGMVVEL